MIYVFTGKGKGKTTAALGVGLRAIGAEKKVLMVQFLKPGDSSEKEAIKKLDSFTIKSFGREGFFVSESELEENPELKEEGVKAFQEKDKKLMREGLKFAQKQKEKYDVMILDEINLVLRYNLIKEKKVLNFLESIENTHLILTGRYCPEFIKEEADLITKAKEIKHYYNQGREPIKGIDL